MKIVAKCTRFVSLSYQVHVQVCYPIPLSLPRLYTRYYDICICHFRSKFILFILELQHDQTNNMAFAHISVLDKPEHAQSDQSHGLCLTAYSKDFDKTGWMLSSDAT